MYRLNKKAWKLLLAEVQKCSGNDQVSQIEQEIVIKRLEKLRTEKGSPVGLDELRETVIDIYPQFSEKVLKKATKANQPPGLIAKIKWATILLGTSVGVIWVVNLPYPMIRWPVAKTVPILLLPSYISMDHNYRGAIHNLEQADQLINRATSPADIERGGEKVKTAKRNLDNLPVWFLGYYPQAYCNLFGCTWRFTVDILETRLQAEIDSQSSLKQANEQIQRLIAAPPSEQQQFQAQIQGIISQLNTVQSGTTAYAEAQILISQAKKRLQQ
jgi:hypothetical protein